MKALRLDEFLEYRFLSDVQYAPGGERAAFVVSVCNEEENCYESRLWLYEGETLKQLTDLGKEGHFIWEDDTHILFPAVRSAADRKRKEAGEQFTVYYRLDITGGEALYAFTLPYAAGSLEHVNGDWWAVTGRIDVNTPDYYKLSKEERAEAARAVKEEKDYEVFDESPFWGNGRGVTNKQRTALFLYNMANGESVRVTEPYFNVDTVLVHDEKLFIKGSRWESRATRKDFSVYEVSMDGALREVGHYHHLYGGSMISLDGKILLLASEGKRHGLNENKWVYELQMDGALRVLREEEYNMYGSVGSDCRYGGGKGMAVSGKNLYHIATREGNALLYKFTCDGESVPVVTKPGSIDAVDVHEDRALLIAMYDNKLQELYSADLVTGEVSRISHFNDNILEGKYVAEPVSMQIQSEGWDIEGWVMKPMDYDPEKSYPAVLDIHGGPKTVYGPVFYHEMQYWASLGYFVFYCNPMGGDGRDNRFMDIRGHYGETDYKNIMDFTDAVLEAYPQIDRNKVCVTGGSYGGFMTNWIIGHTDRFVCAASQRSIANWVSFYGVSDIGIDFGNDQNDGNPFDDAEKLWQHSPMKYVANVKTPTLFIHSDEDYRCPLAEGLQMYTSLQAYGVPTRLCLFHGENHELSRSGLPKHRVRRLKEITEWFEKYAR